MEANQRATEPAPRRGTNTAIAGVFAASLTAFLAIGAVLPVLPRYVHGPIGAGDVAVGVVVGAFAVTAIVSRPWAGRIADERGRRPVTLFGLLAMVLGGALLFVDAGVPGLLVARLIVGIGEGVTYTAVAAWVVDLSPPTRRAQLIGLLGLSVWIGLSGGPVIGEALRSLGGYDAVWAFATAAPLGGLAIAWAQPSTPGRRAGPGGTRPPLVVREALGPGLALALGNAGYAALASFVVLHLADRGTGHGVVVFTAFAVSVVAGRLLLGHLPDRIGPLRAAVGAAAAEAAGLVAIALAGAWPVALAGAVVMGAGFSVVFPALALLVIDRVPEERRGAALGSFTAAFDAGYGLGAPAMGLLAALGGYALVFWAGAACAAAAAVVALRVARAHRAGAGTAAPAAGGASR
ncbi:MAG: MFS transporter [Solirubrobacteraceae bacterium]|nr:MFS transporter [Solirubrobacteraceae bacterium]